VGWGDCGMDFRYDYSCSILRRNASAASRIPLLAQQFLHGLSLPSFALLLPHSAQAQERNHRVLAALRAAACPSLQKYHQVAPKSLLGSQPLPAIYSPRPSCPHCGDQGLREGHGHNQPTPSEVGIEYQDDLPRRGKGGTEVSQVHTISRI
jgi:hypothetical protein